MGISAQVLVDLDDLSEALDRSIRPQAVALGLFAALTALAGAVVLGQTLVRQTYLDSGDSSVLSALGMSRGAQVTLGLVRAGFVGSVAAVVAVGVAVLASPLMPIGLARRVEPDPGLAFDALVLALGVLATFGFAVFVGGASSWRVLGRARSADSVVRPRRSRVAGAVARAGAAPSVSSGVRVALERGTERRSAPVASSVVAIALALFTVTGALTFGAGLDHLLATPRLTGWNWDVAWGIGDGSGAPVPRTRVEAALRSHPSVEAFAAGTFFSPFPDGRPLELGPERMPVSMFSFAGDSPVGPSVIRGRAPRTDREVLVGTETLEELGVDVGDAVLARGQAGSWEQPGAETIATFEIVGTGVIPFTERLGRGAAMTSGGAARLNPDRPPDGFFLRLAAGADERAVVVDLTRRLGATPSRDIQFFIGTAERETFAEVRDLGQVDRVPFLFAALMGLMAAAVLVNVLASAVRAQRTDLAVLRTLGFDRRRVRTTVVTQSCTYVLVALAVALPLGIVAGRLTWLAFADGLRVVPEAPVPSAACALVIVAAILVAVVVAVPLARRVVAGSPARGLRTE